jgi:hypothetical protein
LVTLDGRVGKTLSLDERLIKRHAAVPATSRRRFRALSGGEDRQVAQQRAQKFLEGVIRKCGFL